MNAPKGISIDPNDILYISEWGNNRISLFTREGYFLRSFGAPGNGLGQFLHPTDIMVLDNGVIHISDYNNGRVQIF